MSGRPGIPLSVDGANTFLPALVDRVAIPQTAKEISLPRAAATYLMFKRRRLTESSERGYRAVLDEFTINHPGLTLAFLNTVSVPPSSANYALRVAA